MRRLLMLGFTLVFVLALLSFTATYTVRFTEAAVRTTFGRASEADVKREPGLYFKWPYPVQAVTTYDTRSQFAEARLETQQTADNRQVTVQSFSTWRVSDPLKFFQRFSNRGERAQDHFEAAEQEVVIPRLRAALSETSRYRLNELFAARDGESKLPELEGRILAALTNSVQGQQSLADIGIEIVDVGLSRIVLPEETTKAVFERMTADRNRLVGELESKGNADANAIRTGAKADADRILAFTQQLAQEIRAKGEAEATQYYKQMEEFPELAVFLKNLEFMRDVVARRVTLVLPTSMPGFEMVTPGAMDGVKAGQFPRSSVINQLNRGLADVVESQSDGKRSGAAGGSGK